MSYKWVLILTAYQLNVIEQKYEEHTAMTGLLLWLKGTHYCSQKSFEMAFLQAVSHTVGFIQVVQKKWLCADKHILMWFATVCSTSIANSSKVLSSRWFLSIVFLSVVERTRNATKKYRGQFCYVINILFSSNHLNTSICWCNPSSGWNYKIVRILPHTYLDYFHW